MGQSSGTIVGISHFFTVATLANRVAMANPPSLSPLTPSTSSGFTTPKTLPLFTGEGDAGTA